MTRGAMGAVAFCLLATSVLTSCIKKTSALPNALTVEQFKTCTGNATIIPKRDTVPLQNKLDELERKFAGVSDHSAREKQIDAELCKWLGSYFASVERKNTGTSLGLVDWTFVLGDNRDKLNVLEVDLFNYNITRGIRALSIAKKAEDRQEQLFATINSRSRNGDAFKHAYWNALLARDLGEETALLWADAHEHPSNSNPVLERKMDFLNNAIGRSIGRHQQNASDEKLEAAVLQEIQSGGLWRVCHNTPKPGTPESYEGVLRPTSANMLDTLHTQCDAISGNDYTIAQERITNYECPWYVVHPETRQRRNDSAQIAPLYKQPQEGEVIGGMGDAANDQRILLRRIDLSGDWYLVQVVGPSVLQHQVGWVKRNDVLAAEQFCGVTADFEKVLGPNRESLTGKNAFPPKTGLSIGTSH